jgi:hypothetical protein
MHTVPTHSNTSVTILGHYCNNHFLLSPLRTLFFLLFCLLLASLLSIVKVQLTSTITVTLQYHNRYSLTQSTSLCNLFIGSELSSRRGYLSRKLLKKQELQSQSLLARMLPTTIVQKLQTGRKDLYRKYDNISVCYPLSSVFCLLSCVCCLSSPVCRLVTTAGKSVNNLFNDNTIFRELGAVCAYRPI